MLHFVYTYSEHTPRNGHTTKAVKIYRIKRNKPVLVATGQDQFVDEFQLVMQVMEANKLLPRKAFERSFSNSYLLCNAWALREDGIADVVRV